MDHLPCPDRLEQLKTGEGPLARALIIGLVVALASGCGASSDDGPVRQLVRKPVAPPADGSEAHVHTNQLVHETSPYLLQHAHNPVNWHPWGDEAFEKARKEGKPIFLSVGYSTCYWCHVMERESFERDDVAAILNKHYIAIKVDREELPDVDEQYMLATQLVAGRGGWPNSVWLTPDGKPWMAGTYFPREQFKQILTRLANVWDTQREQVEQQADKLSQAIRKVSNANSGPRRQKVDQSLVDQSVATIRASFDRQHAGFGDAPKFPPHSALRLLFHECRRTNDPELLQIITDTLDAMARGGIRDHVGGGFHRYATDRKWFLPHFEKMLYDNAQLLRIYTDGYLLTGDERFRAVVEEIFRWTSREMTAPSGAFYSALDSESHGEEGRFYVWRYDEVLRVLGAEPGRLFADVYGFQAQGNWVEEATRQRPGTNIPYLPDSIADVAQERNLNLAELQSELEQARTQLLAIRNHRNKPHRDDKTLASWNGLMISSLAYAGRNLDEPRYVAAAAGAAQFVLGTMRDDDRRLLRTFRDGQAKQPGYLDDYAYFVDGLLELHASTGQEAYLQHAIELSNIMLRDFEDRRNHGFYFSSDQHDELLMRSKNLLGGGNLPSPNGTAAQVLLQLGQRTGDPRFTDAARRTLQSLGDLVRRSPRGNEILALAVAQLLNK